MQQKYYIFIAVLILAVLAGIFSYPNYVNKAIDYLNSKAVVFIHDFQRPHYWDAIKHYRIVDIIGNMAALEKNNSLCREKDRYFLIKKYLWMS